MKSHCLKSQLVLCLVLLVPLLTSTVASAQVTLRFAPADTVVEAGHPARLSIICDEVLDLRTIEVYVEFDTEVLTSLGGGPGDLFTETAFNLFDGFELSEPNVWHGYCVIMGAYDFITSPGELFYWDFEGIADGLSAITAISVGLATSDGTILPDVSLPPTTITIGASLAPVGTLPRTGLNTHCYPNPFNPATRISFSLPDEQQVRLGVHGIDGELVKTLINETRGPGAHEVTWNGRNDSGQVQASGLYFYRIEAGHYCEVRKMTLMK